MRSLRSPRAASFAAALAAALVLGGVPAAHAATTSGSDNRPFPDRVFAPDSFWYRELPAATPQDPNSAAIVDHVVDQAEAAWGKPGQPHISLNTDHFTPPMYVAQPGDPTVTFRFSNCQGSGTDYGLIAQHLTNVRIPADAVPASGSDGEMVVYDATTDRLTEVWQAERTADGGWSACWGGSIPNASKSHGVFPGTFGVTATGLPLAGGVITADELRAGKIDHVVGLALPNAAHQVHSSPAVRHDGWNPGGRVSVAQGQMMRLPADLDLDSLKLSPVARTIAEAAQKYGVIVWDSSGSVGFRLEAEQGFESNPYPELFRGRMGSEEMAGDPKRGEDPFPLDKLEVLPMNWETPSGPSGSLVPPAPAPAPSQAPAPEPKPEPTKAPAPAPTSKPTPEPTSKPKPTPTKAPAPAAKSGRAPYEGTGRTYLGGDTFDTAQSTGWGKQWTVTPAAGSSVSDGAGILSPKRAGTEQQARLAGVQRRDLGVDARFTVSALPQGEPIDVVLATRVTGKASYRTIVRIAADGDLTLEMWARVDGRDSWLGADDLGDVRIEPGQTLRVNTEADKASPTALRARAWVDGDTRPEWQISREATATGVGSRGGVAVAIDRFGGNTSVGDVRLDSIAVVDPSS